MTAIGKILQGKLAYRYKPEALQLSQQEKLQSQVQPDKDIPSILVLFLTHSKRNVQVPTATTKKLSLLTSVVFKVL